MILNQLRYIQPYLKTGVAINQKRCYEQATSRCMKVQETNQEQHQMKPMFAENPCEKDATMGEMYPTPRKLNSMTLSNKDSIVLSFDDVPGPKALKYFSSFRQYISEFGTQLTANVLALAFGTYVGSIKPLRNFSVLFDEYGPVVRFVSPVGGDVVLINHPDHIQKVYNMEGEYPVRSCLDSLEKYRIEHRNRTYGLFSVHGQDWSRQRSIVTQPLYNSVSYHLGGINEVCETFAQKVYKTRNYQDELSTDLYKELHKWAFDSMGLILFSKKFTMLSTDLVYSQCDMSWLYHSLDKATDAIIKCESGMHFWKMFPTPAWASLVKYCDSLDGLIGKHVMEAEQDIKAKSQEMGPITNVDSMIHAMLMSEEKMNPEDIATLAMDMLLIGVNTITSSMSFLLYYLAKYQKAQKELYKEICNINKNELNDMKKITEQTPYLHACIKETLRLVPPIPMLTRVLSKNITLDGYNIPRGTLIIMSTQDSSLKESNYEDATVFSPERWLKDDAKEYHPFASLPFGSGVRKCLAQDMAKTMLSLLAVTILQKYKLEYYYGDVKSTRSFIARPNKALKIRFADRV